ncbi:Cation channel sperm-associated protein subunit gamma, partial [Acipenser ruthenus]
QVSIDSCWVGSLSCPQASFSSTIQDVISTESAVFIRQNQLVYRFTGDFALLPLTEKPSEQGSGFLILTGSESFTDTPLVIRGVEFNPYSWLLILWGNTLICSYDSADTYMFFTGFPATQMIKYFALSFQGEFTFITEDEERMRFESLPPPNLFSRIQHYRAEPPEVLDPAGFYSPSSLSIYHGLLYQLLWLHSQYNRPYGDPVHDPTWRWWKNKAMYEVRQTNCNP